MNRLRFLLLSLAFLLGCSHLASAQDSSAPNVIAFEFTPKTVDVTDELQIIAFIARLTDEGSGLSAYGSQARFTSPSGSQLVNVIFAQPDNLLSGDSMDGIYASTMNVPRYSETGTWRLSYLVLVDAVGNMRRLFDQDMLDLGFPVEFTVTGTADTSPPNVLSFDFSPKTITIENAAQGITFTTRLTDDVTGIPGHGHVPQAQFESPSFGGVLDAVFSPYSDRISGDELDGVYQTTISVPQYSEGGTWRLAYFSIADDVGNTSNLTGENMVDLGFPVEITFVDSDADSLSDVAEVNDTKTNPNIPDTDQDGVSDGKEVFAGTNPLDRNSFLKISRVEFTQEGPAIEWTAVPGRTYVLQTSRNLQTWDWVGAPIEASAGEFSLSATDPEASVLPKCFYKIEVLRY